MFKPRPFTGALREDVNEWLVKFDRFAKFSNWNNVKKVGAMVLLFDGPALSWFQTFLEEPLNSLNGLVEALKGRLELQTRILFLDRNFMPGDRGVWSL